MNSRILLQLMKCGPLPVLLIGSLLWAALMVPLPAEAGNGAPFGKPDLQASAPYVLTKAEKDLMNRLARFTRKDIGKTFDEKILTDGHVTAQKPKTLLEFRHFSGRKQHIYLFKNDRRVYGFAWVEKGGKSLEIPDVPEGSTLEKALHFTGDSLTESEVSPGQGVVILQGATEAWLKTLPE